MVYVYVVLCDFGYEGGKQIVCVMLDRTKAENIANSFTRDFCEEAIVEKYCIDDVSSLSSRWKSYIKK